MRARAIGALAVIALAEGALAPTIVTGDEALFQHHCGACHQPDGRGTPGVAPPLTGDHWRKLLGERSYLPRVVAFGMTGAIKVGETVYSGAMAAQPQLDDGQLASVLNHVAVTLNPGALPPDWRRYSAEDVARVRASPHATIEQRNLRRRVLGQ